MRRFIKFDETVRLLKAGWKIFTERGIMESGSPLFFILCSPEDGSEKNLHPATIKKLIKNSVIGSVESDKKYRLLNS